MSQIQDLEIVKKNLEEKKEAKITLIPLAEHEINEVESTFSEIRDFRMLGEKIVGPMDSILSQSLEIIGDDPIMNVSDELSEANKKVQSMYNEILNNDGIIMKFLKQIPGIGSIARFIDIKFGEVVFNIKSINAKIEAIFSGFDMSYNSINTSVDIQKKFLENIESNIGKIYAYKDILTIKLEEFKIKYENSTDSESQYKYEMFFRNVDFFINNLNVLISNLELARKRIVIRLDSSVKLALAMNSSRPIFKVLLSSAVVEIGSQKAIDASTKSIQAMGETIDQMSKKLTDSAIESNKKAEELSNKAILDTKIFIQNVEKLKQHFDTIENMRKNIKSESDNEKLALTEANNKLKEIKENKVNDYNELSQKISE